MAHLALAVPPQPTLVAVEALKLVKHQRKPTVAANLLGCFISAVLNALGGARFYTAPVANTNTPATNVNALSGSTTAQAAN